MTTLPPAGHFPVTLERFWLSAADHFTIADTLDLPYLPPLMVREIENAIEHYKMGAGLPRVSAGQNIAAIDEALNLMDKLEPALRRFTDMKRSGVGEKTVHALYSSASKISAGIDEFRAVAQVRKKELRGIGRLGVKHGPLGSLCGFLRYLFDVVEDVKNEGNQVNPQTYKKQRRAFALAVFKAAGIPCEQYNNDHSARMDPLFDVAVPDDTGARSFADRLRQEIRELLRDFDQKVMALALEEIRKLRARREDRKKIEELLARREDRH